MPPPVVRTLDVMPARKHCGVDGKSHARWTQSKEHASQGLSRLGLAVCRYGLPPAAWGPWGASFTASLCSKVFKLKKHSEEF